MRIDIYKISLRRRKKRCVALKLTFLEVFSGSVNHLDSNEFVATFFEPSDDLPDEAALHAIGLDNKRVTFDLIADRIGRLFTLTIM
jgi:hypothetical protein